MNALSLRMGSERRCPRDALQQPTLLSDDERLAKAADEANNLLVPISLKLGDTPVAQVNADAIAGYALARRRDGGRRRGAGGSLGADLASAYTPTRRVARSRAPTARR